MKRKLKMFEKEATKNVIELPDHYDSIDYMPMLNWDKIHKTTDMIYLLVKPSKLRNEQKNELAKVWEKIYNEFIETFGFSEQVKDVLALEIKIAKLKLKKIITKEESIQNFIRAHEKQLAAMKEKRVGGDVYKTKESIEKHFNFRISMNDCTVREFYSYLKNIK